MHTSVKSLLLPDLFHLCPFQQSVFQRNHLYPKCYFMLLLLHMLWCVLPFHVVPARSRPNLFLHILGPDCAMPASPCQPTTVCWTSGCWGEGRSGSSCLACWPRLGVGWSYRLLVSPRFSASATGVFWLLCKRWGCRPEGVSSLITSFVSFICLVQVFLTRHLRVLIIMTSQVLLM